MTKEQAFEQLKLAQKKMGEIAQEHRIALIVAIDEGDRTCLLGNSPAAYMMSVAMQLLKSSFENIPSILAKAIFHQGLYSVGLTDLLSEIAKEDVEALNKETA